MQEVKKASKNACRTFCSSINDISMSARLHRGISRGSLVASLGRRTQSGGETLEFLLTTHFPIQMLHTS